MAARQVSSSARRRPARRRGSSRRRSFDARSKLLGGRHLRFETLEDRRVLSVVGPQVELFGVSPALFVENQGQWAELTSHCQHRPAGSAAAMSEAPLLFDHAPAMLAAGNATTIEPVAPVLHGLYLVDADVENLRGQVIYLNHDGAQDVIYNGPVTIGPFDVPAFEAPGDLAGQEDANMAAVAEQLNALFAPVDVTFTLDRPDIPGAYSTVYIAGDGAWAREYGDSFLGLAEDVDVGNVNHADNAFVFSTNIAQTTKPEAYVDALVGVIVHETGHLLGYAHDNAEAASGVLDRVAADGVTFISETIPDNTQMAPGQNFTKTWTLRNSGTTTWTTGVNGYTLNYVSGAKMGAPNYVTLSSLVAPNGQTTFSVPMTAPTTPGTYTGYWRMNNSSGVPFGFTMSVKIIVQAAIPATPTNPTPGNTTSPGPVQPSSTVTLSWNASSGATYYNVGVRDMGSGLIVASGYPTTTSFTATLDAGKTYRWNVAAGNSSGESSFTTPLYFQTPAAVLPGPTITSPGTASDTGWTVSTLTPTFEWNAVAGASRYSLNISKEPYGTGNIIYTNANLTGTSFTLPSGVLQNGVKYRWNMVTLNSAGQPGSVGNTLYFQAPAAVVQLPDLVVSALSVNRSSVTAGEEVTVTFTVTNQGAGSAPATPARIRLASGMTITPNDPLLAEVTVGALGSGQSQTLSRVVTIPSATAPSGYYMGVTANATGPVEESNPNNNQRVTPITVTAGAVAPVATTPTGFVYPTGRAGPYASNMPGWLAGLPGNPSYHQGYYHLGQDMEARPGDPVCAIAAGEIIYVSTGGWGSGNYGILVRHRLATGETFLALYGHVRPIRPELRYSSPGHVYPGIPVSAGEVLATVGPADGVAYRDTHLHFGIRPGAEVPSAPLGRMPLPWQGTNGFVNPVEWINTHVPHSPASPVQRPGAPHNLGAESVSSTAVDLTWQPGSANVQGYRVQRKVGNNWQEIADVGANVTVHRDTQVAANTVCVYRVLAYNVAGTSDWSREVSVTTPAEAVRPEIYRVEPWEPVATGNPQLVTIMGAQFHADAVVRFRPPVGDPISPVVSSRSDTHITVDVNFGTVAGEWVVEVINPGEIGVERRFDVLPPPGESPIREPRHFDVNGFLVAYEELQKAVYPQEVLREGQREGLKELLWFIENDPGLLNLAENQHIQWAAYMLATTWHEGARPAGNWWLPEWKPVPEVGGEDKWYEPYYGRGYVQLTHDYNYEKFSFDKAGSLSGFEDYLNDFLRELGWQGWDDYAAGHLGLAPGTRLDLVSAPDLALKPEIAYAVMSFGMRHAGFRSGHALGTYIRDQHPPDYAGAREIIQPVAYFRDRNPAEYQKQKTIADKIAGWATKLAVFLNSYGPYRPVHNSAFRGGSLSRWTADTGAATTAQLPDGTYAARLATASPVTLYQAITTPDRPFNLSFDYQFETTTGTFDVMLNSVVLASFNAPDMIGEGLYGFEVTVGDTGLFGLEDAVLAFRLDGTAGSRVLLTNIVLTAADVQAPTATGVFVRGSAWTPEFLNYLDAEGLGHPTLPHMGYRVDVWADQPAALPWTNLDTISVAFTEDVMIGDDDFAVAGASVSQYDGAVSYNAVTHTATWTLAEPLPGEKLLAAVSSSGLLGSDLLSRLHVLPGDVTGDGMVISNDLVLLRNALGTVAGHPGYSPLMDLDGNGMVISNDLVLLRNRLGTTLPDGEPVLPEPPAGQGFSAPFDLLPTVPNATEPAETGRSAEGLLSAPAMVEEETAVDSSVDDLSLAAVLAGGNEPVAPAGAVDRVLAELAVESDRLGPFGIRAARSPLARPLTLAEHSRLGEFHAARQERRNQSNHAGLPDSPAAALLENVLDELLDRQPQSAIRGSWDDSLLEVTSELDDNIRDAWAGRLRWRERAQRGSETGAYQFPQARRRSVAAGSTT